jgi:hypothetical protein
VFISSQKRGITPTIRRERRRRSAIEPAIGHMKSDGHLGRNFRRGTEGDAANVILATAGHNLRLLRAWLAWLFACLLSLLTSAHHVGEGCLPGPQPPENPVVHGRLDSAVRAKALNGWPNYAPAPTLGRRGGYTAPATTSIIHAHSGGDTTEIQRPQNDIVSALLDGC